MKLGTLLCEKKKWCDMSKALNNFRDEMQPIIKSKEKTNNKVKRENDGRNLFILFCIYIFLTHTAKLIQI